MNTTIKLSVATALAFGAVAAHASIALPSSGTSDAILFAEVLNSSGSAVASYAGDTGVSLNTLIAGLTGTKVVLGGDASLAKLFAADVGTDTLEWAVEGGQWSQPASTTTWNSPGVAQFITTVTGNNTATKLASVNNNAFVHWATLNTDIGTVNTNSGGASSVEGASPATAGVWDYNKPSGTMSWYSNGPATANLLGGTENLYYVTGATGSAGSHVLFTSEGTASLSASGLTLSGSGTPPPPVPLPPAVWLLGSGLLGLAGVARRKSKA